MMRRVQSSGTNSAGNASEGFVPGSLRRAVMILFHPVARRRRKSMVNTRLQACVVLLASALSSGAAWSAGNGPETPATTARSNASPAETQWADLIPKGWDPTKSFQKNGSAGLIDDGSLKAMDLMREMRNTWDNAPTNQKMDGVQVRLPGYIVPLEESDGQITEFLLVPYFGACIHSPPPPANQIVHVNAATPPKGLRSMDAVWVTGTLKATRKDSVMGMSGYEIGTAEVARYVEPKRR